MTRKQAILEAISVLKAKNTSKEIIDKLNEILHNNFNVRWTKELIVDSFESFIIENGRIPSQKDLDDKTGLLPKRFVISQFFKVSPSEWIKNNFPSNDIKKITRKIAITYVIENVDNDEVKKVFDMLLREYPKTSWNIDNVSDCIKQFWEDNGRLPYQDEYNRKNNMPNLSTFEYKWGISKARWLDRYMPEYSKYAKEREDKLYSIKSFISEYKRIKPCTLDEFEEKRNPDKVYSVPAILRYNKINGWKELLANCKLEIYYPKDRYRETEKAKIKKVEIIIV